MVLLHSLCTSLSPLSTLPVPSAYWDGKVGKAAGRPQDPGLGLEVGAARPIGKTFAAGGRADHSGLRAFRHHLNEGHPQPCPYSQPAVPPITLLLP